MLQSRVEQLSGAVHQLREKEKYQRYQVREGAPVQGGAAQRRRPPAQGEGEAPEIPGETKRGKSFIFLDQLVSDKTCKTATPGLLVSVCFDFYSQFSIILCILLIIHQCLVGYFPSDSPIPAPTTLTLGWST